MRIKTSLKIELELPEELENDIKRLDNIKKLELLGKHFEDVEEAIRSNIIVMDKDNLKIFGESKFIR